MNGSEPFFPAPRESGDIIMPRRGVSRMRKVIYWFSWLMLMAVLLFSVTHTALSQKFY
jgi:hypothetical protein